MFLLDTLLLSLLLLWVGVGDFDSCYCGLTEIGQPSFQKYMNLTTTNPHTATIRGAMNSLFYAGGFFGAVFNSWCADRFGRKKALATGATIMIISSALCAGSVTVSMFIVFRFFTGWR